MIRERKACLTKHASPAPDSTIYLSPIRARRNDYAGAVRGIKAKHAPRIRRMLNRIGHAASVEQLDIPGTRLLSADTWIALTGKGRDGAGQSGIKATLTGRYGARPGCEKNTRRAT